MKKAARIAMILVALLAAALLAMPWAAPLFVFRPEPLASADPRRWGVAAEEISFAAADGSRLSGWWAPPPRRDAPVLLLVHGRSGNIATRADIVRRLVADGFGILAFDYRGYGASGGRPSERALREDALAARDWLAARAVAPERIVIVGQSLGNAPAAFVAARRPAAALVLISPFTSLPGAAAARARPLGWIPWPVNRFDVAGPLAEVDAPVLLVVARGDELVPRADADRAAAAVPRRAGRIEEQGGHDGLLRRIVATGRLQAFARRAAAR